jgi:hypothetical protein
VNEETFTCIRCGKDEVDGKSEDPEREDFNMGFQFFHRGCLTADEMVIADADEDAETGDLEDICFLCHRKGDLLRGGLRFLPVHDDCLTEGEWEAIAADDDAFIAAWDKAFPGDTYEKAPEAEFSIRQAHAQEIYEQTIPRPEG